MKQKRDVIVVGGGIIGLSVAYYIARQGRSVTLLEREAVGAGSSQGNAGLIANGFVVPIPAPGVPSQGLKWMLDGSSPFFIKPRLNLELVHWLWKFIGACNENQMRRSTGMLLSLGQASLNLFDELIAQEDVDFGFEHKGRLILFAHEESLAKWQNDIALLRELGVSLSLLEAEDIRRIEPNVLPTISHGIYCPAYAHLDPAQFVGEMARLAKQQGVEILAGTAVTGFETSGGRLSSVISTKGEFIPNQVVLAAGAWSPIVVRGLKLRLPIQPAKGYSLTYKRPAASPQLPLSLAERKIAVTPMGEKLRFSSTLELAGFNPSINHKRLGTIRRTVKEYLPGMADLEEETAWFGYRPMTPDDLPIIGRSGIYNNLILATGHGMLGMTFGLITGKLVSQIIMEEEPFMDLTPFRADRF